MANFYLQNANDENFFETNILSIEVKDIYHNYIFVEVVLLPDNEIYINDYFSKINSVVKVNYEGDEITSGLLKGIDKIKLYDSDNYFYRIVIDPENN